MFLPIDQVWRSWVAEHDFSIAMEELRSFSECRLRYQREGNLADDMATALLSAEKRTDEEEEASPRTQVENAHTGEESTGGPTLLVSNSDFRQSPGAMSPGGKASIGTEWMKAPRSKCFRPRENATRSRYGLFGSDRNRFSCLSRDVDLRDQYGGPQAAPTSSARGIEPRSREGASAPSRGRGVPAYTEVEAAYAAKGGMCDDGEFVSLSPGGEERPAESIAESIRRRLASDPLRGVKQRSSRPTTDYERLMAYVDNVAVEVGCGKSESDGAFSRYVRVCALVKILHGQLNSEQPHQCVVDECFAVCVLETVARPHSDGIYEWKQTSWEKVDGKAMLTHSMKLEWKECMECVSGFFFSICGGEVGQTWEALRAELLRGRRRSVADGSNVLEDWKAKRAGAIMAKESTYGPSWTVSFAKNSDWATVAGLSASRMAISSENHLFSRPAAAAHFKHTYECAKDEEPRLCFTDCVLMFGPHGYIVEDTEARTPRSCRFYQFFNFDLIDPEETDEEKEIASATLRKFLASTWHGNEGAHHAEMMALTLAFCGREVGRFFILPDRSNAGKTTHDTSFCYFLGADDSSGRGSMGRTLCTDWRFDGKAHGLEGRRVLHCKFTRAPDPGTRPILSDTYKRLPTLATQKLRKLRIDLVFGGTFGMCLRFLETNFSLNMIQRDE